MKTERVIAIIDRVLCLNEGEAVPEASLSNDLGADFMDINEIVIELEEAFCITITDQDIDSCRTVQDLINIVENHIEIHKGY